MTFKERISMTQNQAMYGEKKDVSDYQAFECRAWVYLDKRHLEKGKHTQKGKGAVNVGFVPNMSAWAFWVLEDKKIVRTDQERLDEHEFPFRIQYNKLHVSNYRKVHHDHDKMSNVVVLKVESQKNKYNRTTWSKYLALTGRLY